MCILTCDAYGATRRSPRVKLCHASAIPGGHSPTCDCCVVGNKENGEQDDAEDQVRERGRDKLAGGARKIQLREPDVGVGGKGNANNDANGAKNLCDSDGAWVVVAAENVKQGKAREAREEANQTITDVPVQVDAVA